MLEMRDVDCFYGEAQVLRSFSLAAEKGEILKSTAMKAIMGLVPPARGEVSFAGQRIERLPPYRIARLGLGYVPEERRIFTELSVMENLEVGRQAARDGVPVWTEEKLFQLFPNLGRACASGRAGACRAASSRCSPSPAP